MSEKFISKDECRELRGDCLAAADVQKINLALFGQDGRGGIVKDIADIKTKLDSISSVIRQFGAPVVVAVVVALIVRFLP